MIVYGPEVTGSAQYYTPEVKTANFTGSASFLYALSSSGIITASLPANPVAGDSIKISNVTSQENLIDLQGNNFMGQSDDIVLDTTTAHFELVYTDSTTGWVIIA